MAGIYLARAFWALNAESCESIGPQYLRRVQLHIENLTKAELSTQERMAIVVNLFFCPHNYIGGEIMAFIDHCAKNDEDEMIRMSARALISNYEKADPYK